MVLLLHGMVITGLSGGGISKEPPYAHTKENMMLSLTVRISGCDVDRHINELVLTWERNQSLRRVDGPARVWTYGSRGTQRRYTYNANSKKMYF